MCIVAHRRLRVFIDHGKNRFFYNLNVQGNRRGAPTLAQQKPCTGAPG